jgi:effector-binding domain-containing protein
MAATAEAARILDGVIQAHGGLEALKALDQWTARSSGVYLGMAFSAVSTFRIDELRMDITMKSGERMSMVTGERNCWMRSGPVVVSCPPAERAANRDMLAWERAARLWPLKEEGWRLSGATEVHAGLQMAKLTVSKPGLEGEGQILFDPETRLIRRFVHPAVVFGQKGTIATDFGHYHPHCGVRMPRSLKATFEGRPLVDEQVQDYGCGPVDPNLFPEPLQVADGAVEQKEISGSTVACHLFRGPYTGIGSSMQQLSGFLSRKQLMPLGAPLMIYKKGPREAEDPAGYETEVCMPVGAPPPGEAQREGDFVIQELAPAKVLSVYGLGDYAKRSGELVEALMAELAARKLTPAGAMRQVTHHDPRTTPADQLVSEMQIPVQ